MIGLEIHCQMTRLKSKLFCRCRADYRTMTANRNTCPICLGFPGTLPLLNSEAVRHAISLALSLNCRPNSRISFFRKNYFYPDLPKNFQITQFDAFGSSSMGGEGAVDVDGKSIRISRIQLEEDPGRLVYEKNGLPVQGTLIDYNRAGCALVEIVTEPDFDTPQRARRFLNILADVVVGLGVADPHLEGAIRADGNVSVRGGNKVEVKNVNSFHDLEKALHFELTRQNSLCDRGIEIVQETRHWDDRRRITIRSRVKESEMDYRYFLEADIPPVQLDEDTISRIQKALPESPDARLKRYTQEYGMAPQVASSLVSDRHCCDLFEEAHTPKTARTIANMLTTDYMGIMDTREKRTASHLTPDHVAALASAVDSDTITRAAAKGILYDLAHKGGDVAASIRGVAGKDQDLRGVVERIMQANPQAVQQARQNPQAINYVVGLVMKETRRTADPKECIRLIRDILRQ